MTKKALPNGNVIDFANPKDYTYTVEEIATLLARVKRFNGLGISVAQHSINVAEMIMQTTGNPYLALRGLLHDASEAYLGDLSTPLKELIGNPIALAENAMDDAITAQLNPRNKYHLATQPLIKVFDLIAMRDELENMEFDKGMHGLWDFLEDLPIIPVHKVDGMGMSTKSEFINLYDSLKSQCDNTPLVEVQYQVKTGTFTCYINPNYQDQFFTHFGIDPKSH